MNIEHHLYIDYLNNVSQWVTTEKTLGLSQNSEYSLGIPCG